MKMRLTLVCLIMTTAWACGSDDPILRSCVDNGGADCWDMPTETLMKNDTMTASNFNCVPATVQNSTAAINVTGTVFDFQQSTTPLDGAVVTGFAIDDLSFGTPLDMATSAVDGSYALTLPSGTGSRMNWRTTHSGALDTYSINATVDIAQTDIVSNRSAVSILSANAIPALVGTARTPGLGTIAGGVGDCDGDGVRNAIATVSSTSGVGNTLPTFIAGAEVYYFAGPLPVGRSSLTVTGGGGGMVALNIETGTSFFQIWGFVDSADVAMGEAGLTLISEFTTPSIADSVLSIGMEPTESL